ncbi:MAG TPA: HlyD family efflux transporter periplasmic adaptor subunit [Ruminiclostridium sp.]|nr:HlyD family efflux transporter periplasmic adaptor subunit [Ruminiclostridium sp.]
MNTAVKRILTILVSLVLIVYVGYQACRAIYNPFKTMRVTNGTYDDIIKSDAYVIHSEVVINSNQHGVLDYVRQDGESVSKGGEVAALYASEQDARNQHKIQTLDSEIQSYSQLGSSTSVDSIDIAVLNSEIEKNFMELSKAADSGDINDITTQKANLLSLFNKKQLATGEVSNFDSQIAQLQKERDQTAKSTGAKIGSVTSPEAGYFVSSADGLENAYDFSKVQTITADKVKSLLSAKAQKPANTVGKVITGYDTYIACTVSSDEAYSLHVGDNLEIRFLLSSQGDIPVTVSAINKDSSGVAVVLKCSTMTGGLAVIRRQAVEIVAGNFSGIRVQDSFIHIVNGKKGVFIRKGNLVNFKKIDTIFSSSGYTVSAVNDDDQSYLQVYDEVIENGDDLYDGKVIK